MFCPERERGSERIKTAKHSVKRYLAYLLVCALVMSNISVAAYAADTASVPDDEISITQEETISDPENDASSDFEILKEENAESSDTEIFEEKNVDPSARQSFADESVAEEEAEAEPVVFEQSQTVNNMVVTVKADPGVFPVGAALSVEFVSA